jgi:hypothetical protein
MNLHWSKYRRLIYLQPHPQHCSGGRRDILSTENNKEDVTFPLREKKWVMANIIRMVKLVPTNFPKSRNISSNSDECSHESISLSNN